MEKELTQKEQHFLVQAFYKKTAAEMRKIIGIEIDQLFKEIPEKDVKYFLDN